MTRLWSSGFELQSATSGTEWETTVGSPSINTTTKRTGAASLRCNPTAASAYLRHTLMTGTTTSAHVYLRAYVYIATLPSANSMLMGWIDSSPFGYGVRLTTAGKLQIGGTNSVLIGTASTLTLNTGQWYRIELDYDDGTDVATCYVDGVSACTLSGADTFGGALAMFGLFDSCTADVYFDDIAVNDNSGSVQNGLPGAGSIVHLKPNAAGDNNGFATAVGGTAGAANNYTRVSEVTPDDLTTYNNSTATGTTTIDDFNVDSSASAGIGASDTVTLVQVGQRMGSNAATTASIVTRIKGQASGTTTESASLPVNVNGFRTHALAAPYTYKITAYTNPQTSTAWTSTTLDSMQVGYRGNVSQSTSRRISTIWALVEFVPIETHTTSGTGSATATGTGAESTVRTTSGTGGASATATGAESTVRTTARTGSALAGATGAESTVRTTARTGSATATATGVSSGVRSTSRTAGATATATGAESTVRTTSGTAGATATATYTSSSDVITAGTGYATATATGVSSTVRTTARTGSALASATATESTVRTTARTAFATATATGISSGVRSTSRTGSALAGATGAESTVRTTTGTARATATGTGTSSAVISAMKVRQGGEWVSATARVRESAAWVPAGPNRRESGSWVAY